MSNAVYFSGIRNKIIESLDVAETEIQIAVAWFTDKAIIKTLEDQCKRGIRISIIINDDKINDKNLYKNLYDLSADIRTSNKLMHNKFCIIDQKTLINGSYNWTYNASTNDENIQITKDNSGLIQQYHQQFKELQTKSNNIGTYFKTLDEKYFDHLKSIETPIKYPCFMICDNYRKSVGLSIKQDFILLNNHDDFRKLNKFNFYIKRSPYDNKIEKHNLNYYDLIIDAENGNSSFYCKHEIDYKYKYKFIYDDTLSEIDLFMKNGLLKCDTNLYRPVKEDVDLEKLYQNVFTWTEKYPNEISNIEDFKKLIIKNLNHRYAEIDQIIYLYKIYFNLLNLNTLKKEAKSLFTYFNNKLLYAEKDGFWYLIDPNNEIIIKHRINNRQNKNLKKFCSFSDYIGIDTENGSYAYFFNSKKVLKIPQPTFRENWIHSKEWVIDRYLYGLIGKENEVIFEPLFDKIIEENESSIIYCVRPQFWLTGTHNNLSVTPASYKYDQDIEKSIKEGKVMYFEYKYSSKTLTEVRKSNKEESLHIYCLREGKKYISFYKYFINLNKPTKLSIVEETKKYIEANNYLNLKNEELFNKIETKIIEINKREEANANSCYIATLVYQDVDHPKVEFLRNFRDEKLLSNYLGRVFVKIYYKTSPKLVTILKPYGKIQKIIRFALDKLISILQ